jgi:hypothetical protein
MLSYNPLVTAYLMYLGLGGALVGILLGQRLRSTLS